jgi:hypothetical protein
MPGESAPCDNHCANGEGPDSPVNVGQVNDCSNGYSNADTHDAAYIFANQTPHVVANQLTISISNDTAFA